MNIESVTLQNFRCFGPTPTTVALGDGITALVGANGAGKSAFIEALRRLFGITREERTLTRADVHFGPSETPETVSERQVVIDVVLAFPELATGDPAAVRTVPTVFRVMTAAGPGDSLKARLRLEAYWRRAESYIDEVETAVYWVNHLEDVEFGEEAGAGLDKQKLHHSDRGKIQLVHVPATRDGGAVTRQALRHLLRRLERSGDFEVDDEKEIQELGEALQERMQELPAVEWATKRLSANWNRLHTAKHLSNPRLVVLSQDFTQLLRSLTAKLSPAPDGRDRGIDELSEGQASLFFLALSATLAQLEAALSSGPPPDGFADLDITPPALTIYAIEEPENHLAPFYLSRLMGLLEELCEGNQAMGLVTSHAPSILRRLPPEAVRHFRLDPNELSTRVNPIRLPEDDSDAAKFVREAVLAQPEIYFASLVILGEGDSEEIVVPRVANALGINLDPSFVAFAPLGGRHVNHFWRLLAQLNIPFLTLLDFDLGRHGAGPLRLKYAYDQLSQIGKGTVPQWAKGDPESTAYWKGRKKKGIHSWREWLKERGVFFSYPLDLDMSMIEAFPAAYGGGGPAPKRTSNVEASVFGKGPGFTAYDGIIGSSTRPTLKELAAYDALFKKRGKPGSHLKALSDLTDEQIRNGCPESLRDLILAADAILRYRASADSPEG